MVRSAAAVLAVLILPTFALGQEPQGTHTVVTDDTLWDLAQRYYSNPFEWRVIWNANQDVVEDPNWIYPDEVLVIPGLPGETSPDEPTGDPDPDEPVEDPGEEMVEGVPADLVPFGLRQARPVTESARSIFYTDPNQETRQAALVEGAARRNRVAVSRDVVYSAPWLIGLRGSPVSDGLVAGHAERGARAESIRSFDQIRITMPAPARVGAELQLFRVERTIQDVGHVVIPSGVARVTTIGDGDVVAMVTKEYDRVLAGDLVRALPAFNLVPGDMAEDIQGGSEAMIMGFAGVQVVTDIGHVAFLDLGSDDGITIGDEFILYGAAVPTAREGALQVIGVTPTIASARVLSLTDNVFRQGVVVRLAKKMR